VIADRIEAVAVDLALQCGASFLVGAELLIEDTITKALAGFDFIGPLRLAQQQVSACRGYVLQVWQRRFTPWAVFAIDAAKMKVL
jgi:hypothetical protein